MAIIKPFSVGKTKGKLGDIIYYEVAGEIRARMVPTEVKDAKTPKQMAYPIVCLLEEFDRRNGDERLQPVCEP